MSECVFKRCIILSGYAFAHSTNWKNLLSRIRVGDAVSNLLCSSSRMVVHPAFRVTKEPLAAGTGKPKEWDWGW